MFPVAITDKSLMMEHAYQALKLGKTSSTYSHTVFIWAFALMMFLGLSKISFDTLQKRKLARRVLLVDHKV